MSMGTNFTASNGESRNPFYQGQFEGETAELAEHRRHWALAAKEAERAGNKADKECVASFGGRL